MALTYEKFLLFGDSITEFSFNTRMNEDQTDQFSLGAALVNAYTRKLDIVQRGFSGYNSRWALKLLPKILEQEQDVAISTLFFGSNDSCQHEQQNVPLPEFKENTIKLIQMLKNKGIRVVVVGPALHDQDHWYSLKKPEVDKGYVRSNELYKQYSDAAEGAAREEDVAFVNLYEAFKGQGDTWPELLCDGLHFTGKGYEVMFNEVLKAVNKRYPEYSPANIEYKLPNWRLIESNGSTLDALI
ncbi:Iah1 [Kluyveromyces lactis]|nr:Iah1 [Kluyveromyces lactis]